MHTAEGDVWFSGRGINGDRGTFGEIFVLDCYPCDYRNAVVVDIGAHKGYFGAYAFLHGAKTVLSYEPEEGNFAMLERTAESFRSRGHDWRTHQVAVGSHERQAELNLARSSWSHSLLRIGQKDATGGLQPVTVAPIEAILDDALTFNASIIVKIDAEGAECEIVLDTAAESWAGVHDLFVETHSFAPCSSNQVVEHLPLRLATANGVLHFTSPK